MPTAQMMYWVKAQKQWLKEYRGKTYSVSCRQLKCEPTKEASRLLANDWWDRKQKEIDELLGEAKKHPAHIVSQYHTAIENHRLFAKWQRKYGHDLGQAEQSEIMIGWLNEALASDDPPFPLTKLQEDPLWRIARDIDLDDQPNFYNLWSDRLRTIRIEEAEEKAVPKENTIRAHIDDYLAAHKTQARSRENWGHIKHFPIA